MQLNNVDKNLDNDMQCNKSTFNFISFAFIKQIKYPILTPPL